MKKILFVLALLMPLMVLGQNREFSQLYEKAEELFEAGKYEEAIEYLKKCDAIDREQLEPSHQAEYDIAICRRALAIQLNTFILKYFSSMTNQERTNYWNKYSYFFNNELPKVAYMLSIEPSYYGGSTYADVSAMAYNGQLLSKGLLLNAELEIQSLIERQGNEQLKDMYYKIKQNRIMLDNLYQLTPSERTNLKNNDIAIEFANFTDSTDQTIYTAIVIKKGMESPELVKLDFVGSDTVDYSSPTLYNKIWKPLDKYLQGVQNLYFAPSGKFHTIGIEYLPNGNGEIFAKQCNAYRLSSTRELTLNHTVNPAKKASVYGGIKILHVATHGFYEPENKKNSFANMLFFGDEHLQEDRSMSRSGLFFAGANTFLSPEQRQFIPDGVDDGILTAKEISRLDFKGLDLVVLSACETGLGEVTGEGVFGLQRGFKKAGAQTIIMSLWKVNDKPAKEFMTEFYRNLMAGKSKREAFIAAQDKTA